MRGSEAVRETARPAGTAEAASDDAGFIPASGLSLKTEGARLHAGAATAILGLLEAALAEAPADRAGVRLRGYGRLAALLSNGSLAAIAREYLGLNARPVRAILFDKSPATNWTLGWHQDRTIAVRERHDTPGYGPWSVKHGIQHVEPPFDVIAAMITMRIHLDDVPADNAPLLIAPGSHCLGKVAESAAARHAERIGPVACLADRGDIWVYSTPILHASERSVGNQRRRVLQVDLSASALPSPLAWLGI